MSSTPSVMSSSSTADNGLRRAFDVLAAGAALFLLSPLLFAIALLVKLTSPGPALYCAGRVGVAWARAWPGAELGILLVPCAALGLWAGVVWTERRVARTSAAAQ